MAAPRSDEKWRHAELGTVVAVVDLDTRSDQGADGAMPSKLACGDQQFGPLFSGAMQIAVLVRLERLTCFVGAPHAVGSLEHVD
jgi:hypothetical protein